MFRTTSALTEEGIDDLFKDVGSKYLDTNYKPSDKKSGVLSGGKGGVGKKPEQIGNFHIEGDCDYKKKKGCSGCG